MGIVLILLLTGMGFVAMAALARDGARKVRRGKIKRRLAEMGLADGFFLSPVDFSFVGLDVAGDRLVIGRDEEVHTFAFNRVRSAEVVQTGDDQHITRLGVKVEIADDTHPIFDLTLLEWRNRAGLPSDHQLVLEASDFGGMIRARIARAMPG